jgi:hypothetical protein
MHGDLLQKIKSRGYWRFNLRPLAMPDSPLSMTECAIAVERSSVQLRGWDYPHIQRNEDHGGRGPAGKYYESWTDWTHHIEFWRMYRSSQFLHYRALWEDWLEESLRRSGRVPDEPALGITGATYTITELFEFADRMARGGLYGTGLSVSVSLGGAANRTLWVDDTRRMDFLGRKETLAAMVEVHRSLPADKPSSWRNEAVEVLIELFDNFGWEADRASISDDQTRFLSRMSL